MERRTFMLKTQRPHEERCAVHSHPTGFAQPGDMRATLGDHRFSLLRRRLFVLPFALDHVVNRRWLESDLRGKHAQRLVIAMPFQNGLDLSIRDLARATSSAVHDSTPNDPGGIA